MSNIFLQQIDDSFTKGMEAYSKPVAFMEKTAAQEVEKARKKVPQITVEKIVVDDAVIKNTIPQNVEPKKEDEGFVL